MRPGLLADGGRRPLSWPVDAAGTRHEAAGKVTVNGERRLGERHENGAKVSDWWLALRT